MTQTIYLADDEKNIRDLITAFLTQDGFAVTAFENGDDLRKACEHKLPDLAIIDIMMPGTDGLSICSTLRRSFPELPIIIVSAKDSPYDRVTGLTLGGDDYLVKPFLPLELVARVHALLRRAQMGAVGDAGEGGAAQASADCLAFGPLRLWPKRRQATLDGKPFPLTPTEFDFLVYMVQRQDRAVSREELLRTLWEIDWKADTRATDDLVKRLRRKLCDAACPICIETVWGFGFRISLQEGK